jgi:MFS transporter, SHS family, sialic acid transporter
VGRGAWMALIAALLGWMFDGLEMGLFPLVARPAINDLLASGNEDEAALWRGVMYAVFLVGAATGGVIFGWLGDRIGRVRAMTLSVLTYAVFMGLCGLSRTVHEMFFFRFVASLGMGGEWSLGVALVMEVWPNRSRGLLAGLIGAAANVGFLSIGLVGLALGRLIVSVESGMRAVGLKDSWVDYLIFDSSGERSGWRLLMLVGAAPALLTFFIRLMVPESERWLKEKQEGAVSHWAMRDMLGVLIGALGPMLIIYLWANNALSQSSAGWALRIGGTMLGLLVALVGYTYPVIRYLRRTQTAADERQHRWPATIGRMLLAACLSGVALIGTWASMQNAPSWADQLVEQSMADAPAKERSEARASARSYTQIWLAVGAIFGTIAGALVGDAIGRRITYTLLCGGSLLSVLAFFQLNSSYGAVFLLFGFVAGGLTASFYGWLPLYLPELFRTRVRATGQGFSFNFGRILAAVGALQTGILMKDVFKNDFPTACSLMSLIYVAGMILIWFMPETRGQPLPE